MGYAILIPFRIEKKLSKLGIYEVALTELSQLKNNPRNVNRGAKPYGDYWRIKAGSNYRIIYDIEDKQLLVLVVGAGHRKNVYKDFKPKQKINMTALTRKYNTI